MNSKQGKHSTQGMEEMEEIEDEKGRWRLIGHAFLCCAMGAGNNFFKLNHQKTRLCKHKGCVHTCSEMLVNTKGVPQASHLRQVFEVWRKPKIAISCDQQHFS